MTADPVAWGLAASMARPGGNVTGVTADVGTELVTKHLELLRELTPTASRLGLLAPKAVLDSVYFRALRDAAQKVGVAIIPLPLESPINEAEYRRVFAITAHQVHGLLVGDTPENFANRSLISELAVDHRVPACTLLLTTHATAASWLTGLCFPSLCDAWLNLWTKSSRARSRARCHLSNRRGCISSST